MSIALILVAFVAIEHVGIMLLEMFGKPETQSKSFNVPESLTKIKDVRVLFANQGIYNGMLGVTIAFVFFALSGASQLLMLEFMMGFVIVVAIFGTFTATKKIILMQGLPAILALLALVFNI
jgi:putative membrane protein